MEEKKRGNEGKTKKKQKIQCLPKGSSAISWTDSISNEEGQRWHKKNNIHMEYPEVLIRKIATKLKEKH